MSLQEAEDKIIQPTVGIHSDRRDPKGFSLDPSTTIGFKMVDKELMSGIAARIVSYETGLYLNNIVGIDGWANFAIALKAYADCRQATSSENNNLKFVYLMLMGYALENLAKCIIARKAYHAEITDEKPFEKNLVKLEFKRKDGKKCKGKGGKEDDCILATHNLDDLYRAKDISFNVSDTVIDHLRVISIYTQWKGRYPVPLTIIKVPSSSEPSFEDLSKTAISIYDQAMAEVEKLRSSRS